MIQSEKPAMWQETKSPRYRGWSSNPDLDDRGDLATETAPSVFLIEDDLDIREAVEEILTYEGISVKCFPNGQAGLMHLTSGAPLPRVILLDLMMPVMDGHEFLRQRERFRSLESIPVVVMTADSFVLQNQNQLLTVSDLVKKPIDLDRLIAVVRRHVDDGKVGASE